MSKKNSPESKKKNSPESEESEEAVQSTPEQPKGPGRPAKEISVEDLCNDAKALIIRTNEFIKQHQARGKNTDRFHFAIQQLERLTKNQYVE